MTIDTIMYQFVVHEQKKQLVHNVNIFGVNLFG